VYILYFTVYILNRGCVCYIATQQRLTVKRPTALYFTVYILYFTVYILYFTVYILCNVLNSPWLFKGYLQYSKKGNSEYVRDCLPSWLRRSLSREKKEKKSVHGLQKAMMPMLVSHTKRDPL